MRPGGDYWRGSDDETGPGTTFEETGTFVSGRKQIGTTFLTGTCMENATVMIHIETRFPHRGRAGLQGVVPNSPDCCADDRDHRRDAGLLGCEREGRQRKKHVTVTFH